MAHVGLKEILHPPLHHIETGAIDENADGQFQEDYQLIKSVCEKAIVEAQAFL